MTISREECHADDLTPARFGKRLAAHPSALPPALGRGLPRQDRHRLGARNYTCAPFAGRLAGGILVALNPGLAPAEVRCLLDHSEANLLFYDAEFASDVGDSLEQCAALRAIVEIPDAEFGCSESGVAIGQDSYLSFGSTTATDESPVRWEIDDERAVISINYTSGTTGKVVKASVACPLSAVQSHINSVIPSAAGTTPVDPARTTPTTRRSVS